MEGGKAGRTDRRTHGWIDRQLSVKLCCGHIPPWWRVRLYLQCTVPPFRSRMAMPDAFLLCLESCMAVRAEAKTAGLQPASQDLLKSFSAFLKSAFGLFLAVQIQPWLEDTPEYQVWPRHAANPVRF
eukprot:scaffold44198_cov35-Prasinocladus_malaysianus.AAC.1